MPKAKNDAEVYANAEKNIKKLKAGKLGRIAKLKRTAKELIGGSKTYLPKKKKKKRKKLEGTQRVEKELSSNLTKEEIARFGGK